MGFIKGRAYPIILAMAKDGNEQAKKLLDGVDSMGQDEVDGMISEIFGSKTSGDNSIKDLKNQNFNNLAKGESKKGNWKSDLEDQEFEQELQLRLGSKTKKPEEKATLEEEVKDTVFKDANRIFVGPRQRQIGNFLPPEETEDQPEIDEKPSVYTTMGKKKATITQTKNMTKEQKASYDRDLPEGTEVANLFNGETYITKKAGAQDKATLEKTVVPIMPRGGLSKEQQAELEQETSGNNSITPENMKNKFEKLQKDIKFNRSVVSFENMEKISKELGIGPETTREDLQNIRDGIVEAWGENEDSRAAMSSITTTIDAMMMRKDREIAAKQDKDLMDMLPEDGFDPFAQKARKQTNTQTGTGKQLDALLKETGGNINGEQANKIAEDYGISVNEVYNIAETWKQDQAEAKQAFPSLKKDTVKAKVDNIAKQVKRQDGTYKIEGGKPQKVDLNSGFSASFFRPEITDQQAEQIESIIGNQLGSQYVGVFGGEGELSYNVDQQTADTMANIFNQESVWNNETQKNVPNPNYDPNKKVDYKQAIEQLKKALADKKLKGV